MTNHAGVWESIGGYEDANGNMSYFSPYTSQQGFGTATWLRTVTFDLSNNIEMKFKGRMTFLLKDKSD